MNCPGCNAELPEVDGDQEQLRVCPECGGVAVGASELNRLLLHSNIPGIESLGGRTSKEPASAVCRTCQVDLTRYETGDRKEPLRYEMCEECGCVFVASAEGPGQGLEAAQAEVIAFFRSFAARTTRPRG